MTTATIERPARPTHRTHRGTRELRDLMTTAEVAAMLGYHVDSVLRLGREGKIPRYRYGGQYRYRAEDVLAAIVKEENVGATATAPAAR